MNRQILYFFALLLLFASCNRRNLAYISDIQGTDAYREKITNTSPAVIKPDDLLGITVSSINPDANVVFNKGSFPTANARNSFSPASGRVAENEGQGYLVDEDGFIDFPVLGKVRVGGLTRRDAQAHLADCLQKYLKDPTVNLRFLNFRITVIGEVTQPSSFTIPNEKINVFEALGMAGDMSPFGKRENVLLMREEGGERIVKRLNLNDSDILSSPYFYLQQNDIVYVEPVKERSGQGNITRSYIATAASVITALSLIFLRLR